MAPTRRVAEIEAQPGVVWAYLADLSQWSVWDPDMKAVSDIREGLVEGGSFLAALEAFSTRISFWDVQQQTKCSWGGTALGGSVTFAAFFQLEPIGEGHTRLTYEFEMRGFVGRFLGFLKPRAVVDGVETGLANIKAKAEEMERLGKETSSS
mmetsp:Transcript_51837/g.96961  ORF Transcript_51837/g.96961 Transcript_51837/m.96961 type:complete len:152 (+) Transcript_51837:81-536(+)